MRQHKQRIRKVRGNDEVRKEEGGEIKRMRMGIVSFSVGSRTYKFKKPLMLESEKVDGGLWLTHKELSLSACGKFWLECSNIIREELAVIWGEYTLAPDDELTAGAIAFKNKLLAMVEECE